jgi:hypothetical protein
MHVFYSTYMDGSGARISVASNQKALSLRNGTQTWKHVEGNLLTHLPLISETALHEKPGCGSS